MGYFNQALDAFVTRMVELQISSSFIRNNPLLYYLGGAGVEGLGRLGQRGTPAVIGGGGMGYATKKKTVGSDRHEFRYQIGLPNPADFAAVTYGGATPVAQEFAEDNFGTAYTRWTNHNQAIKIRKHALKMARGETAIGSLLEEVVGPAINFFLQKINGNFWRGVVSDTIQTSTSESNRLWPSYIGVVQAIQSAAMLSTGYHLYAGVDRSTTPGNQMLSVGQDMSGEVPPTLAEIITDANINKGITSKSPMGSTPGIDLVITDNANFVRFRNQLEGTILKYTDGIPDHPWGGFQHQFIKYDQTYVTYDHQCPRGTAYCFHTASWMYEVDDEWNFSLGPEWTDKASTEEGGAEYIWNNIKTMGRLTCREPWLQAVYYNMAELIGESSTSSNPEQLPIP